MTEIEKITRQPRLTRCVHAKAGSPCNCTILSCSTSANNLACGYFQTYPEHSFSDVKLFNDEYRARRKALQLVHVLTKGDADDIIRPDAENLSFNRSWFICGCHFWKADVDFSMKTIRKEALPKSYNILTTEQPPPCSAICYSIKYHAGFQA